MKKPLLIFMFGLLVFPLLSQTYTYEFVYDDSGNRTQRTVIFIPAKALDTLSVEENLQQDKVTTNALTEDLCNGRSITLYPNPTTGELILEITPLEAGTKGNITLYSAQGSLLEIIETILEINRLDLSDLLPGNYLLHITLEGKIKTYKIIRQ